jgi:hypothetical protein
VAVLFVVRRLVAASIVFALFAWAAIVSAEPTLRSPKKWSLETTLPTPSAIDPYAWSFHQIEGWVRDRPLWQRNDLLVTLLHDDEYLTIQSGKLTNLAPGAIFFLGPAGTGSGGTVFALRIPF